MKIPQCIENLPVAPHLEEICRALASSPSRFLVLTAETAAGKSTAVPYALLQHFPGSVLMLEPRRLAAVAIAERVAHLLGEESGGTVGYRLHLDTKVGARTRLEVMTEAILTRRLQHDPELTGVSVVVLDEFHERSVHADLALAFLKEAVELRDDLFVLVMSATIDTRAVSEYLGAPVVSVPGRQFPVRIEYAPGRSVIDAILDQTIVYPQNVHNTVEKSAVGADGAVGAQRTTGRYPHNAPPVHTGAILVFLPGIREINAVRSELQRRLAPAAFDVFVLHSSVPLKEQRAVLTPSAENSPRRVILSSAIAETSLTVPGVTVVIDSGLCRLNRMNVALGMERLVTEAESAFSAEQRAGRAGRTAPGVCVRLWDRNDVRPQRNAPEILRTDLAALVLECAQWGVSSPESLSWLDAPPAPAWAAAQSLLGQLGLTLGGTVTARGTAALSLGLSPRLACVALAGGMDAVLSCSEYAEAAPAVQAKFRADLARRLKSVPSSVRMGDRTFVPETAGEFLLEGFPDRIARRTACGNDFSEYQFPSGRKARLAVVNAPEWIVAPDVDAGAVTGKIRAYEPLDSVRALAWALPRAETRVSARFADGSSVKLVKAEVTALGALVLQEKPLAPAPGDFAAAVCAAVRERGLGFLPLDAAAQSLLVRAEFYALYKDGAMQAALGSLAETADEWLSPFLTKPALDAATVRNALHWHLGGAEIDRCVPTEITLANGRRRHISYERHMEEKDGRETVVIQPVLEIIVQQIFGCFETPRVLGRPVLLKLLSPARRPLQITQDLEHFWEGTWCDICKEMKGRYPKHNWDYRAFVSD